MTSDDRMPSVSIHTLGCKLNYAESGAISGAFRARNFDVVPFGTPADVTVINTCSVTEEADRKCRQTIRRALRANPETFVVVTGCYAQLRPEEIGLIDGVVAVLGTHEKLRLFDFLDTFQKRDATQISVSCIDGVDSFGPAFAAGDRTRAFLKIQDGCDYVCSFCTIPGARGRSRSPSTDEIVRQAVEIAADGFREIVLSGVNIGLFGNDNGGSLLGLLQSLDQSGAVDRFRISSIEPNLLTDEIIDFVAASKRFVPHFHIPLQSGDDEILGRMRRRYRTRDYAERIERVRTALPEACIGADVIVGFPGETEDHFKRTKAFLADLAVSYLHVFTYSERPDTVAADGDRFHVTERVPGHVRKRRNRALRLLSERKRQEFYGQHLGSRRMVLWEELDTDGRLEGYTDNYIRVERYVESGDGKLPDLENVMLESMTLRGTVSASAATFIPIV